MEKVILVAIPSIPGDLCNGSEDISCTTSSSVTSNIEESSELTQVSSAEKYIDEESDLISDLTLQPFQCP